MIGLGPAHFFENGRSKGVSLVEAGPPEGRKRVLFVFDEHKFCFMLDGRVMGWELAGGGGLHCDGG